MSFKSNTNALNYARRTSSLGTFGSGVTLMADAKLVNATDQGVLLAIHCNTGAGPTKFYFFTNGTNVFGGYGFVGDPAHYDYSASPIAMVNTWRSYAIRISADGNTVDCDVISDASTRQTIYSVSGRGITGITAIMVGTSEICADSRQAPNGGLFSYFAYWPTTRLSDSDLLAEYPRLSPLKAGASIYTPMLDDLLDDSPNGFDLSSSGSSSVGFDAAMPSYRTEGGGGGGAASRSPVSMLLGL